MSTSRASRFLGMVASSRAAGRFGPSGDGLPFHDESPAFVLHAERPVLRIGDLSVAVLGAIAEVDAPGVALAAYRGAPERLVADLYARYGKDLAQRLDGWFLVIVYDHRREELLVVNNPYTSSTCYYVETPRGLVLANNLKRLLGALDTAPVLDKGSLVNYFNNGYNHTEYTCFEGIRRLLPGYRLLYRAGTVTLERHYEITFARRATIDLPSSLDEYERLFRENMAAFLAAHDVREVGAAISGGLDTSWTFWAAAREHPRPVHGYTVYFGHAQFDEVDHAAVVVDQHRALHHTIPFGPKDFDLLPELIHLTEEPVLSVSLPIYRMFREARATSDALVCGEGGNNVYSIYYPVAEAHKYLSRMPFVARKALLGALRTLGRATGVEFFWQAAHVAKIYAARPDYFPEFLEHLTNHYHFDREQRAALLDPTVFGGVELHRSLHEVPLRDETFFDDLINQNITSSLKPYLLFFEHKMAAEYDMAFAAPFVSKKIVAFVNSLPLDYIVRGTSLDRLAKRKGAERYFHKLAMERIYPREHVHREPQLFYAPFHSMFAGRASLTQKLKRALERRGWYDGAFLDRLFAEHRHQREYPRSNSQFQTHGYRLMALLGCEVWARLFLDGGGAGADFGTMVIEDFLD